MASPQCIGVIDVLKGKATVVLPEQVPQDPPSCSVAIVIFHHRVCAVVRDRRSHSARCCDAHLQVEHDVPFSLFRLHSVSANDRGAMVEKMDANELAAALQANTSLQEAARTVLQSCWHSKVCIESISARHHVRRRTPPLQMLRCTSYCLSLACRHHK